MTIPKFAIMLTFAAGPAIAQESAVGPGVGYMLGIAIMVVVGAVVGWLASLVVKGSGSGFWGDVLIGIGGSILAGFLFPAIGVNMGSGFVGALVPALIGAVIFLLIIRVIRRAS